MWGVSSIPRGADKQEMRRRLHSRLARLGVGLGLVALAALSAALLSSCSSSSSHRAKAGDGVRVTLRDFRIKVAPARVHAGDVRLLVRNQGPDTHELIIVRAGRGLGRGLLPLRSDGLTVDEEALPSVGEEDDWSPGRRSEVLLHLKPGRYELFCNMAGHYLGGMRAELVVT
jgi:uncharacterized cupredoxin-like copper-binding protein